VAALEAMTKTALFGLSGKTSPRRGTFTNRWPVSSRSVTLFQRILAQISINH
jgi:hypothetical protein